jgi:hypothetical protein
MIVIEVTNINELVEREKGALLARLAPYVTDIEAKVEKMIVDELENAFRERGIRADIASIPRGQWSLADQTADSA